MNEEEFEKLREKAIRSWMLNDECNRLSDQDFYIEAAFDMAQYFYCLGYVDRMKEEIKGE